MFDKTRDLNGYEIRLNAISFEPHLQIDQNKSGLQKFTGDNSEIVKLVLVKLNASLNVRVTLAVCTILEELASMEAWWE